MRADVDALVFWTRDPRPLLPRLDEIDSRGYRYYLQFSLTGYPRQIETHSRVSLDHLPDGC